MERKRIGIRKEGTHIRLCLYETTTVHIFFTFIMNEMEVLVSDTRHKGESAKVPFLSGCMDG